MKHLLAVINSMHFALSSVKMLKVEDAGSFIWVVDSDMYWKMRHKLVYAAKKKALEEEMAKHPPGTRLMPEAERQETLRDLGEAKRETEMQLERLPVVAHSQKMERHKKELEEKLARLERAIDTFSKPTVYVAM
mgnify:CR=1 FL=1